MHPVSRVCPVTKGLRVFEDTKVTPVPHAQPAQSERRDCQDRTGFKELTEMQETREVKDQWELPEVLVTQAHVARSDNRDVPDKTENKENPELRETPELTELLPANLDRRENPGSPATTDQSDSKDQQVQQENQDKRERMVSTVCREHQETGEHRDPTVSTEPTVQRDKRENKVSEPGERRETEVSKDRWDPKVRAESKETRDLRENPTPKSSRGRPVPKEPRDLSDLRARREIPVRVDLVEPRG